LESFLSICYRAEVFREPASSWDHLKCPFRICHVSDSAPTPCCANVEANLLDWLLITTPPPLRRDPKRIAPA
jgi:hypothetical protein